MLQQFKGQIHRHLSADALVQKAVQRREGFLNKTGALTVYTGKYTGRSPLDRYIVKEPLSEKEIDWGKINIPLAEEKFAYFYQKIWRYLQQQKELFLFDGFVGTGNYRLRLRVINELASQNLFSRHIFRREIPCGEPELTVIAAPGYRAEKDENLHSEVFIIINLAKKIILIGGTSYNGEIKKSVFTFLNYWLPKKNVFPMHCSANLGRKNDVACFFGLSGTGKTSLSADPQRRLIGDDEHGWSEEGIFNFEGGCYAKCINLKKESEPQIFAAIREGTIVENVVIDEQTKEYYFADQSITENTRAGFPLEYIPHAELSGCAGHPQSIIFLTADAFGVMPLVAKLNLEEAIYYFLAGYTSKLAGTERGIITPRPTFSVCFGAPFMPHRPAVYANLFKKYVSRYKPRLFLLNTGWQGGPYGVGQRVKIEISRKILSEILNGSLDHAAYQRHPYFKLLTPKNYPAPEESWSDQNLYAQKARELLTAFAENLKK